MWSNSLVTYRMLISTHTVGSDYSSVHRITSSINGYTKRCNKLSEMLVPLLSAVIFCGLEYPFNIIMYFSAMKNERVCVVWCIWEAEFLIALQVVSNIMSLYRQTFKTIKLWVAYATRSTLKPVPTLPRQGQRAITAWQIPDAVDTVVCAPDDKWWYHPKHVEQFRNVASCWIYIRIFILDVNENLRINLLCFKAHFSHETQPYVERFLKPRKSCLE